MTGRHSRRAASGPGLITGVDTAATARPVRPKGRLSKSAAGSPDGRITWFGDTTRPMAGREIRRFALPAHRASTRDLQAVYPWMADAGLPSDGQLVGRNLLGGGTFSHDPWEWYRSGVTTNPNGMVFGEIGSRKSTFIKTMIARGYEFGRDAFVTDVKDEYSELAAFLGHQPVFLGPGLPARLNPFDPGPGWAENPAAVSERQLAMLVALGVAVLGRDLTQAELTLCAIAIAELTGSDLQPSGRAGPRLTPAGRVRVPVLPEVIDALMRPADRHVAKLPIGRDELREETADLIMGFMRLIDGDLKAMFDEPTNIDFDPHARFLVVNLSAVREQRRAALPLVRICATSWLQSALARRDGRRRFVIADEAWDDMTLGTLRWYRSMFKLTRQYLVSNWLVFHKPQDLLTAGDQGSEQAQLAESLIADTGTVVMYQQKPQQIDLCRRYFAIHDAEATWLTHLPPGQALWRVGNRPLLVQHMRTATEARFTDTEPTIDDRPGTDAPGET